MSADRITYCLERVSSYRDFERLCSGLLAGTDYPGIDPLGGTGDGGRDAIIRSDSNGRKIVFAYTVRGDWKSKLKSDCARVREQAHNPNLFVFVCTEALTAAEKDGAHELVRSEFGWKLDLFDLERLRVLLVGPQRHLLAQHPSIFTPPFFPQAGGESLSESRDTLVVDHVDSDHALATWLSRRLTLAGFRVWCRGKDVTANGHGMLLGNPHFPWSGPNRFYQMHLTIPGRMDVMGAGIGTYPAVSIGFNKDVAWSHTVSTGKRFTLYELTLASGEPTTYLVDGQPEKMTARKVRTQVRGADGAPGARCHAPARV